MSTKLIETPWSAFSEIFAKFQRLPYGCDFRLYKNGRRKRSDFLVKRYRIKPGTTHRINDESRVSDLLSIAKGVLSTDITARGLELRLYGPDGLRINGNTYVRNVRCLPGKPTAEDKERLVIEVQAQQAIVVEALAAIVESEMHVDDPSNTVCRAYIQALVQQYGIHAVGAALNN